MVGMRRIGKPSVKEGKENSIKVRKELDGSASIYSKFSGMWRKIGLNVLTSPSKGSLSLFATKNEIYHDSRLLFYGDVLDFNCALKLGDINAATSDTDKFLVSDSGTIKYRTGTEVASDIGESIVTTGALNSGSITSGFGNIDVGSSTIDTTGNVSVGDLQVNGNDIAFDAAASTLAIDASAHDTIGQALTISSGSTTAGTTNNIAGGLFHLRGGQGKGSGVGGSIRFSVADGGSSGSSLNAYATAMTIEDDKKVTFGGDVVLSEGDLYVSAASGANAEMFLIADNGEDNADRWKFIATDATASNILTVNNKISGSHVAHLTITPNATVASSNATFAGSLAVNGTDGITAGAVIWQSFPFIVSSGTNSRHYFIDNDDTANSFRRWDSYDSSPTAVDYRTVAGQFVVPEDCTLVAMHGVISNSTSTNNPTVYVYHGSITEGTGTTTLASAGSVTVTVGTSRVPYKFSKEDFDADLTAGDIVVPTIFHADTGGTRSFVGSLTLKFITR